MPKLPGLPAGLVAKPPSHSADLLPDAVVGGYASGDLIMRQKVRGLSFEAAADRTLGVVAADATT